MSKLHGKGTLVKQGSTTIGQVFDISGPSTQSDPIEVTDHDETTLYKRFIGGLIDAGEVSLEIHYDPALDSHRLVRSLLDAQSVDGWSIVFPDTASTTATFDAIVTKAEPKAPVDNKLVISVGLKIDGAVKGLGGES